MSRFPLAGFASIPPKRVSRRSWMPWLAALALLAVACGSGSTGTPNPVPTPIPPTPSPSPTADPSIPPASSGCTPPYPTAIGRVDVKGHLKDKTFWTMDATPLVGPDPLYCMAIGFTDGRRYCPVRPEGGPADRTPCENWIVGNAKDTGRPGPTWTLDYVPCTAPGTGAASGCENSIDNQYQANVYKYGWAIACVSNGVCGAELAEPR
jgi:hypothetical protein